MLKKIRHSIGLFFLQKKQTVKREKRLSNLKEAKSVGVLFEITNQHDYQIVSQVCSELQKQKINISILGICLEKHLPAWLSGNTFPLLSRKDLNNWLLPKNSSINSFCSIKFDILIDLSTNQDIQSLYIVNQSIAHLKAGTHNDLFLQYYDFVIKKTLNTSFENHVKNLLYYLTTINTVNNEN